MSKVWRFLHAFVLARTMLCEKVKVHTRLLDTLFALHRVREQAFTRFEPGSVPVASNAASQLRASAIGTMKQKIESSCRRLN